MKQFKVFFELYGKKMQCTIECKSKSDIFDCIASKINIHKIEEVSEQEAYREALDPIKDLFGFK
jgi:hypothetical protein